MAAKENLDQSLVPLSPTPPALPELPKGISGTVKATEEKSAVVEMTKESKKKEGDKNIETKGQKTQKADSSKTASSSVKHSNEGGLKKTVYTTTFASHSSFEEEEHVETKISPSGETTVIKSIKQK